VARRESAAVFLATWACFAAIGCVLPILPRYVHGPLQAGDVATGLVVGAFAITAIIARPWAGRQADARGRRLMVVGGALLMALGGALLFVRAGVPGAVVARLVTGVGEGVVFTAGSAWIVDLAPAHRRGRAISWYGVSVWAGLSLGPALGAGLHDLGGFDAVWALAAVMPLVGALIAWRQPSDARTPRPGDRRGPLLAREALAPGVALALINAGYATLAGFVGLHLSQRGAGHGTLVFVLFGVTVVLSRLLFGSMPDRMGALRSGVIAALAVCVGLVVVALAHAWPVAAAGGVVMGFGFATLYPALALWVVDRVGEDRRGAALGTFTAFFDAGFGLGAPLAGLVAALGGYAAAFWVAAGYAALSALLAASLARAERRTGG
jgi:predicted MFS family arabinose efflux permease